MGVQFLTESYIYLFLLFNAFSYFSGFYPAKAYPSLRSMCTSKQVKISLIYEFIKQLKLVHAGRYCKYMTLAPGQMHLLLLQSSYAFKVTKSILLRTLLEILACTQVLI